MNGGWSVGFSIQAVACCNLTSVSFPCEFASVAVTSTPTAAASAFATLCAFTRGVAGAVFFDWRGSGFTLRVELVWHQGVEFWEGD